MAEFGSGARALLAASCTLVMVGWANPETASSPIIRTIANNVFTLSVFLL